MAPARERFAGKTVYCPRITPGGGDKINFDWITALLIALLAATLLAFFAGLFPYPIGWIVLTALLVFRLTSIANKE